MILWFRVWAIFTVALTLLWVLGQRHSYYDVLMFAASYFIVYHAGKDSKK